jgi:hypothetical protein
MTGKKKKQFEAVDIEKLINFAEYVGIIPERIRPNVSLHANKRNRENINSSGFVKAPDTKIYLFPDKKRNTTQ